MSLEGNRSSLSTEETAFSIFGPLRIGRFRVVNDDPIIDRNGYVMVDDSDGQFEPEGLVYARTREIDDGIETSGCTAGPLARIDLDLIAVREMVPIVSNGVIRVEKDS